MKVPLGHSALWKPLKLFYSWRPLGLLSTWDSLIHGVFLPSGYIFIFRGLGNLSQPLTLPPTHSGAGKIALTKIKSFKNQFKRSVCKETFQEERHNGLNSVSAVLTAGFDSRMTESLNLCGILRGGGRAEGRWGGH